MNPGDYGAWLELWINPQEIARNNERMRKERERRLKSKLRREFKEKYRVDRNEEVNFTDRSFKENKIREFDDDTANNSQDQRQNNDMMD